MYSDNCQEPGENTDSWNCCLVWHLPRHPVPVSIMAEVLSASCFWREKLELSLYQLGFFIEFSDLTVFWKPWDFLDSYQRLICEKINNEDVFFTLPIFCTVTVLLCSLAIYSQNMPNNGKADSLDMNWFVALFACGIHLSLLAFFHHCILPVLLSACFFSLSVLFLYPPFCLKSSPASAHDSSLLWLPHLLGTTGVTMLGDRAYWILSLPASVCHLFLVASACMHLQRYINGSWGI